MSTHASAAPGTFPALVLHHARVRGARPAMREKDLGIWQTLTWADVAGQVRELAHGLAALGVRSGQHVAIVGENRPRLYLSMMAAQAIGAIPVPLYQDAVAQEMLHVLHDAEIRVAIVEDQAQVDKMLEVADRCPNLAYVVYDDPRGLRNYQEDKLLAFQRLLDRSEEHTSELQSLIRISYA